MSGVVALGEYAQPAKYAKYWSFSSLMSAISQTFPLISAKEILLSVPISNLAVSF